MAIGIWILGDQLWTGQAALSSCETAKKQTPVILIESRNYARQRPYHRQKLVLIWSAMRHFAEELRSAGWPVTYEIADDFQIPLKDWIDRHKITEVRLMNPNDRPFFQLIKKLELGCPITFVPNNHFLWSREDFQQWANSRKRLLLEDFYRQGRKRFKILMEGNKPIGGQWNFVVLLGRDTKSISRKLVIKKQYQARAGIEGTISQGTRACQASSRQERR